MVQKQAAGIGRTDGIECWEEAEPTTFMVRSQNYMQDKKKVPSEHSVYRQAVRHSLVPQRLSISFTAGGLHQGHPSPGMSAMTLRYSLREMNGCAGCWGVMSIPLTLRSTT